MAKQNALGNTSAPFTSGGTVTISSGNNVISSGNLLLPTTSSSVGQIQINSVIFLHSKGTRNIFIGSNSGNTAIGTAYSIDNVGIGTYTLNSIAGGNPGEGAADVACGYNSLYGSTTVGNHTALGYGAGYNRVGTSNISIGYSSLSGSQTRNYTLYLGFSTGSGYASTVASNILIGGGMSSPSPTSNYLRIGNATGTTDYRLNSAVICGINGKTSTSGAAVLVNASNVLGTTTSNRDSKQDIEDMSTGSDVLYQLRPRKFKYKDDTDPKPQQYGMIAEEVEPVFPEMVAYDLEGKPYNLFYQFLAPMLVNEFQKVDKRIEKLEKTMKKLLHG